MAQQKIEIVLAGLRDDRTVREVCREHEIAETREAGPRVGKSYTEGRISAFSSGERALVGQRQKPAASRYFGSKRRWAVLGSNQ